MIYLLATQQMGLASGTNQTLLLKPKQPSLYTAAHELMGVL